MRGTVMYAAGDVRVEDVPDPTIREPTDALMRVTRACICGLDLWPYKTLQPSDGARVMPAITPQSSPGSGGVAASPSSATAPSGSAA